MNDHYKTQAKEYRNMAIFWFIMTLLSVIILGSMGYVRNKELAKSFQGEPCVVCRGHGEGDHILPFKRIPSRDQEWNMWALCRPHHIEKGLHQKGLYGFVSDYGLFKELEDRGFFLLDNNKFWHRLA